MYQLVESTEFSASLADLGSARDLDEVLWYDFDEIARHPEKNAEKGSQNIWGFSVSTPYGQFIVLFEVLRDKGQILLLQIYALNEYV